MLQGIDVSKWQGLIYWAAVAKSELADFAFIRSNFGCSGKNAVDPWFSRNWEGAGEAGVVRGAYQFLRPSQSGSDQARCMLDTIQAAGGLCEGDLSPAVDLEDTDGMQPDMIDLCLTQWIEVIRGETGRTPIIYTGPSFWACNHLKAAVSDCPLWIAHYGVLRPIVPSTWSEWTFWQYTDKGRVSGIKGNVDLNLFSGDWKELAAVRTAPGLRLASSTESG